MKPSNQKYTALGYALLIYMSMMVVIITLIPFDFRISAKINITWSTNLSDFIHNIILFLPIGFLFRLSHRKSKDRLCIQTLGFGILLSSAIELSQLFVAGRYTQIIDVFTNGFGAWLGAIIFVLLKQWLKEDRAVRLLALELPLMNLVYLLIPSMWLNGLSMGGEISRLWLMLLLGLLGVGVISSIYIFRFKDAGAFGPNKLSCFTMGWFFIGAIPVLINFPIQIIIFGAIIGIVSQILTRLPKRRRKDEKRFELPTLKRLLPLYIIYLLLLAVWPTTIPLNDWQFNINFGELAFDEQIVFTFRFIEFIAAFTLFGYMIAEMRGRKNESFRRTLAWIFIAALISSIIIEIIRGYPPLLRSNILEIVFITAAGLYGSVIYRLQLSSIRSL